MRNPTLLVLTVLAIGIMPVSAQETAPAPSPLPGGAQSLNEEHGDWTVSCRMEEAQKLCVMSQMLSDAQSTQPIISIELATPAVDRAEGILLLPFGLQLANGAVLKVDGDQIGNNWPFLTCIASGCLAPVDFDATEVSALRSGKELTISGLAAGSGKPVEFKISLNGFSRAANRSVELTL